jgi:uncharacterized cupin superfamily protein
LRGRGDGASYRGLMVPEARLEQTDAGLVPVSEGWFVVGARDARWIERPGRGHVLPLTGWSDEEASRYFPQLGLGIVRLAPDEPIGMYHWENDQEDFLILAGEALLIIEGQERPLRQWDFVHCPPRAAHMIVGAGDGPCLVLAVGAREHQAGEWGGYPVADEALARGVGVTSETDDADEAYARFPAPSPTRYRDGWLPDPPPS